MTEIWSSQGIFLALFFHPFQNQTNRQHVFATRTYNILEKEHAQNRWRLDFKASASPPFSACVIQKMLEYKTHVFQFPQQSINFAFQWPFESKQWTWNNFPCHPETCRCHVWAHNNAPPYTLWTVTPEAGLLGLPEVQPYHWRPGSFQMAISDHMQTMLVNNRASPLQEDGACCCFEFISVSCSCIASWNLLKTLLRDHRQFPYTLDVHIHNECNKWHYCVICTTCFDDIQT